MLHKLVFDTTDANTIADSANLGAYLRASDGTLLTHTDISGKKALDVNIAAGINVEVDLDHTDDSVRLGDGTSFFTSTSENGDVALDVHLSNSSIAVTATDLDIRDLAFATDKVDVSGSEVSLDAATLAALETITVNQGTSPWVIGDGGGSITVDGAVTVSATQLDIDDLNATDDAVASWTHDGTGTAIGSTAGALDVNIASGTISTSDAALANVAIAAAANPLTAASTAEDVVVAPLAARKYLFIYNEGNRDVFVGPTGVTEAAGFPIPPGAILEMRAGAAIDIEWVGPNTAQSIRTLELS